MGPYEQKVREHLLKKQLEEQITKLTSMIQPDEEAKGLTSDNQRRDRFGNPVDQFGNPIKAVYDPPTSKSVLQEHLDKMGIQPDPVNHPPHYKQHASGIECITITREMNFNLGNAVKYIWRSGEKGNVIQDLEKAIWYLKDEIKRLTPP